jgi:bifunctional non-homologous end joining protein LigD
VIDYDQQIAPVLLPHIADRAVTIKRYPDGVDGQFFYQKYRQDALTCDVAS